MSQKIKIGDCFIYKPNSSVFYVIRVGDDYVYMKKKNYDEPYYRFSFENLEKHCIKKPEGCIEYNKSCFMSQT